jgi:hypothetical protein
MVYAIISIGLLGFIVWSFDCLSINDFAYYLYIDKVMALLCRETGVINFTIGWNVSTLLITFYSKNINNYNQSAGNPKRIIVRRGSSETIRENSFEIFRNCYQLIYSKPFKFNDD